MPLKTFGKSFFGEENFDSFDTTFGIFKNDKQ